MKYRYIFFYSLILSALFCNSVSAQLVGDNAFLKGQWLQVGIAPNGSWGNTITPPAGYYTRGGSTYPDPITGISPASAIDFSYDYGHDGFTVGTEPWYGSFFLPGTPFDGWCLQIAGARSTAQYTDYTGGWGGVLGFYNAPGATLTGTVTAFSSVGGTQTGTWTGTAGTAGALQITQSNRLDTFASWLVVTTKFINTGATTMADVYYLANGDPDNDVLLPGGSFPTDNHVSYQNDVAHRCVVGSIPPTVHRDAYVGLCTKDCRAKAFIYSGWPPATGAGNNLDLVYAEAPTGGMAPVYFPVGSTTLGQDIAMGLVYRIGDIPPGDSAIISYAWIFTDSSAVDSAFPEPQLVVNGVPIAPTGPAPMPTIDSFSACDYPALTSVNVSIANASDKCWSWSKWTWSPSVGLASTTGVNNTVTFASLAGPTTYTITGTDSATSMYSCNHRIMYLTVIPCFSASNNGPICENEVLRLYCHGDSIGATYLWYGPTGFTSTMQNPTRFPVTVADTGWYTVVRILGGIRDTTETHVLIKPLPTVTAGSNSPICSQTTLSLTATPASTGETFTWTGPNGFTSLLQNPTIASTPTANTGLYRVITELNGCFDSGFVNVRVDTTPAVPTPNSNSPICSHRDTLKLTATSTTPGVSWAWTASTGYTAYVQNPMILPDLPVTPVGGQIYSVTVTLAGCSSTFFTVVHVRKTPDAPTAWSNSPVCTGDTLQLYSSSDPGSLYSWNGPNSFAPAVQNPFITPAAILHTGVYSVSATLSYVGIIGGCVSDTSIVRVVVDSAVTSGFTYDVIWGCKADTVMFGNTSGVATDFVWQFGDGFSSIEVNPKHIYITQDSFLVKLTSRAGGCIDSSKQMIYLLHPLNAEFSADKILICQGSTVAFTDASVGTVPTTYLWNFGDGATSTSISPSHTFQRAGVYNVYEVITDFIPCHDTAYQVISVDSTSPLYIKATDTVICSGTHLTLTGDYTDIGNTGIVWSFGNGDSSKNINPISYGYQGTGVFTVTATAKYRICAEPTSTRIITVMPQPNLDLGPDTSICKGSETITLVDKYNGVNPGASWRWNTGQTSSSIQVVEPGYYWAKVDLNGCETSDTIDVRNDCYMTIPNIFSPNGDGINDYFFPRQYLTSGLSTFKMSIYNRWGQLVFETNTLDGRGWDGKLNGVLQPQGVFIYIIDGTFRDGQKEHHQGNVTMLR